MAETDSGSGREAPRPPSGPERAMVAVVAAALPVYLALEGGGFDSIVWQGMGLVVWWLVALAFAFGLLPRARSGDEVRLAALALAGLIAWTGIGLLGTESEGRTFEELGRTIAYAGLLVLAWAALGAGTWRAAAAGLSVAALVVPLIAVASRLEPAAFESVAQAALLEPDRLAYPLGYWNAVAAWSAMAFCLGVAWSAHSPRIEARVLALAAVPVAGVALYLTFSRAGTAALLIGIAVLVVAAPNRATATVHALVALAATGLAVLVVRGQPEIAEGVGSEGGSLVVLALVAAAGACGLAAHLTRRAGLDRRRIPVPRGPVAAGAAVAVVVAVAVAIGPSVAVRAGEEFAGGGRPELRDDPAERLVSLEGVRSETWGSALRAFGSRPVSGIGAGAFQFWWQRDVADGESLRDAHSLYLETLAELGIVGLLALLALLGAILVAALRAQRAEGQSGAGAMAPGLIAAYVVFLFHAGVDWLWEFPALVVLGVGAGVVAGAARASPVPTRLRLTWPRLALVGLAIVAGAAEVPSLVSTNRARDAEEALALGLPERAAELAGEAVKAAPWAAEPYALRGFVALSGGRPRAARADAREAIEREPTNWRNYALLAHVQAEMGNPKAALTALDQAEGLRPGLADQFAAARRAVRSGKPLSR